MKNSLSVAVIVLWSLCLAPAYAGVSCKPQLTNNITDYVAQQLILDMLIDVQQQFLDRFIADSRTEKSERALFQRFLDVTLAARKGNNNIMQGEYLSKEYLADWGVTLVDPREDKVKLAEERARVIANDCPRYRLLTAKSCGNNARQLDAHNFLTFYLRNVQGICGKPVKWKPSRRVGMFKTLFELLSGSKEKRFTKLRKFHAQPHHRYFRRGSFREEGNFFTLFYLDFLVESIQAKAPNFAYNHFLPARVDIVEKYSNLKYLIRLLRILMVNPAGM